jgi:excinuclease UvrABC nuclease subunit
MKLNLNYRDMPALSYIHRRELPSAPGIYYVGNHDCPVMYIGLAHNLKKRHLNHHRQVEFNKIENAVIYYRVLGQDVLAKISSLREVLMRLEKQSISYYKPPLNYTPVLRSIYLQGRKGVILRFVRNES